MALTGALDVPVELLSLFRDLVRVNDQRRYGSVAKIGHLLSREQKLKISTRSLLPQISAEWASLTTPQKNAWKQAAAQTGLNGWNLFVQDTSYRIKHAIAGLATPSDFHQYKVGRLEINAPADRAQLAQFHPAYYYKSVKVRGTKALYQDVKIEESLALPLEVGLSYRSDLTATSGSPVARFYAKVLSHYQGRNVYTETGFDIDLSSAWQRETVVLSEVVGVARSYVLYLDFDDVRGSFEWDNLLAEHTGTNYGRDIRCTDVNNQLTRVNYQIEKSWEEQILPSGAAFDSVYPED